MVCSLRPPGRKQDRRGSALILTALALIPLLAMVAFAVDWGRLCVTKAELQRAADSAAMAAAWELLEAKSPAYKLSAATAAANAKKAAMEYSAMNTSFGKPLELQDADIQVGFLANPTEPNGQLDTSNPEDFNAVRVRVRRDAGSNGSVPMFFARVFSRDEFDSEATATAAFIDKIAGFRKPLADDGPHIPILPFALDLETWQAANSGVGPDEWKWDASANKFVYGSDGIPEFNLYPERKKSAAGRGTVNIGTSSYDLRHLARQIYYGISLKDWEFHNGSLTFNEYGELYLTGRRGINPSLKFVINSIRNQGRIVPVFSKVEKNRDADKQGNDDDDDDGDDDDGEHNHGHNNVNYTMVEFAGISIIDVQMQGRDKKIVAQAGQVMSSGTVAEPEPKKSRSKYIVSRVWLAN